MKRNIFRIALISSLLIASLFSGGAVFAQDEELPDPGITPDSPFYFMDKMGKSIGMFFAFGNEAKAKKALKYGEERLAEVQAMAKKNRIREMERAANDYEGYMAMVNERLENGGISDNTSERVCLAAARHLAVLDRIQERVRDQAGEAIRNAENASVNGQVNALRSLGRNRLERAMGLAGDAIENHMERARLRLSTGNFTTEMEQALNYAARIAELEDELNSAAEEQGIDITAIQERLAHSTANRLGVLDEVYGNAPESARHGIENAIGNSVRKYERAIDRLRERNALGDVPDEATVKNRIRAEVRERLQITIRNVEDEPEDTVRITTETQNQEQNQEHLNDNNGNGQDNGKGSGNQTQDKEQQGNQGQGNNGQHGN